MAQMNSRTWLFVGFALIGVFILAQVAIEIPSLIEALSLSKNISPRAGREHFQIVTLATPLFKTIAGLFLIIKGPLLARYLANREERLNEKPHDALTPPSLPQP